MDSITKLTYREIDKLIAEKVLKFKCLEEGNLDYYENQYALGFWRYSTRYEDAFDLVERLRKDGFKLTIYEVKNGYHVYFEEKVLPKSYSAKEETIQMAICLAALKAVGYSD